MNSVLLPSVRIRARCQVVGICFFADFLSREGACFTVFVRKVLWDLLAYFSVLFAHFRLVEVKKMPIEAQNKQASVVWKSMPTNEKDCYLRKSEDLAHRHCSRLS